MLKYLQTNQHSPVPLVVLGKTGNQGKWKTTMILGLQEGETTMLKMSSGKSFTAIVHRHEILASVGWNWIFPVLIEPYIYAILASVKYL